MAEFEVGGRGRWCAVAGGGGGGSELRSGGVTRFAGMRLIEQHRAGQTGREAGRLDDE